MTLPIYNIERRLVWVFLDLDDTLWDFADNSLRTLRELYINHEYLSILYPAFDSFSKVYHEVNDALWKQYERGEVNADTVKRCRFERTLEGMALERLKERAEELQHEYLHRLGRQTELVNGALELLEALSKKYMIGILSNGFREVQYEKLYRTELWRYVQRMVLSDEIGVSKPNPALFRYAEQATGARPETTLMIGDNPKADIEGAIQARWQAIYFDRYGREDAPEGVQSVHTLAEVLSLLAD